MPIVAFYTSGFVPIYACPSSYVNSATPDSQKRGVIDDGCPVSFVTYDATDRGWHSVIVTGRLDAVTEAAIDSDIATAMKSIEIPIVDVFDRAPAEITFRFFRLVPDEVTGRKEARTDD